MTLNSIIKRLPEHVINQIKAGEVIERPLNVVKELLENSLDASSTVIKIELLDGGKRFIQVSDNGSGISRSEIPLAIERHTTSKLNEFEDLESLKSFGFRGEALASISSVSKFSIKTKTKNDEMGREIFFENAHPILAQDVVMTTGTIITIKDIFQNVPARLKFLRATATEFSIIHEFLTAMSLASPHVSFQFVHNGRVVFDHKAKNSYKERFIEIMGADSLHYAEINFSRGNFSMTGFAILPEKINSVQNSVISFVNGRFVKDRLVRAGVYNGYHGLLMKGVKPNVVLFVHLDPKMIDVNAHPAKIEIRFYDPMMIQDFISRGIEEAVKIKINESLNVEPYSSEMKMQQGASERRVCKREAHTQARSNDAASSFPMSILSPDVHEICLPTTSTHGSLDLTHVSSRGLTAETSQEDSIEKQNDKIMSQNIYPMRHARVDPALHPVNEEIARNVKIEHALFPQPSSKGFFARAKFLNQFAQCYLIFENQEELWFIDQHAFHERILFEELQSAHKEKKIPKKTLLNPTLVSVSDLSAHIYEEYSQLIGDLGFELELIKQDTIAIHSMPNFLNEKHLESTFTEVTQKLCQQKFVDFKMISHHYFATVACHSAIRSGESMSPEFVHKLMNRGNDVDFFAHCPHGRPVIRKFSQNDVARWFERI